MVIRFNEETNTYVSYVNDDIVAVCKTLHDAINASNRITRNVISESERKKIILRENRMLKLKQIFEL